MFVRDDHDTNDTNDTLPLSLSLSVNQNNVNDTVATQQQSL